MKTVVKIIVHTFIAVLGFCIICCNGLPMIDSSESRSSDENGAPVVYNFSTGNSSSKNLYVIKAVVYEIGILTDSSDEDNSTEAQTQERVDLTFFDAHTNRSHIDLGQIPLPVQTNISGQVLTGIAPIDIGAFSDPSELIRALPLTGTIVNITHSDTAFFQLTAQNFSQITDPNLLDPSDLAKIPQVAETFPSIVDNTKPIYSKIHEAGKNNNIT